MILSLLGETASLFDNEFPNLIGFSVYHQLHEISLIELKSKRNITVACVILQAKI